METKKLASWTRRGFLGAPPALAAAGLWAASAQERPAIANPRAVAGDVAEPKWESQLTITVGRGKANIMGASEKAIQAAIDYMAARGGGTVQILPGTYRFRNAVALRSGIRVVGSGPDSVVMKAPEAKSALSDDSDYWDQEVTLADSSGFQVGDGVCLEVYDVGHRGHFTIRRTLVARSGNRFKLDQALDDDSFSRGGHAVIRTLFPLFSGDGVTDVTIENIALDGNKTAQETLYHYWGNYVAGVWLNRSNRITVRKVTSRNSCADGLSWQTSHDVVVEECHCHDNVGFGLHTGGGSQRPTARGNKLERNYIGFYFCYGSKYGVVQDNTILDSLTSGVSIGNKDTDNLVRGNEIRGSGEVGVLFREGDRDDAPHRTRLEANRILDNGGENGIGVDVQGDVESIAVSRNEICETRQPLQRIGVRIGPRTKDVTLEGNTIQGFSASVKDLHHG